MSDNEFANFVHRIAWVDGNTRHRCAGSLCGIGLHRVVVTINASYNSHLVDPTAVPPPSVIVQRVVNNGGSTTLDGYHLRPKPFEYYFEVMPQNGKATYLLWELDPNGHKSIVPTQKQIFFPCDDHGPSGLDEADFANCGDKWKVNVRVSAIFAMDALADLLLPDYALDAPAWISCPSGCCTNAAQ